MENISKKTLMSKMLYVLSIIFCLLWNTTILKSVKTSWGWPGPSSVQAYVETSKQELNFANYIKQNQSKPDSLQVQLKLQFKVAKITQKPNQTLQIKTDHPKANNPKPNQPNQT